MGKHRWKGKLHKPIYIGSIPIEGTNERLQETVEQEIIEKLQLLMKHYGIADKDDYLSLALALASNYVPGIQVKQVALKLKHGDWGAVIRDNIGRHKVWPPEQRLRLLNAVEEAKQRHKFSTDHEALSHLAQHGEWSRPADRGEEQWLKTLKNQLAKARFEGQSRKETAIC